MRSVSILLGVFILMMSTLTQAFYDNNKNIVKLTEANFKNEVLKSDEIWLIEFYAPWCGHCKNLAPEWEKAAKALKGVVKVGAVDMTTDQSVGQPYNIQGFPTIKLFGLDKKKIVDYNQARDAPNIVKFVLGEVQSQVNAKLSGKSSSSSSGSSSGSKKSEPGMDGDVYVLEESNFDKLVLQSKDIWMLEFYAPWCGHCKALQPEWDAAATAMKGQVKFGKIDATVHTNLAQRYGVKGYPTLKAFEYGEGKKDNKAIDYNGARDKPAMIEFASKLLEKADISPDIHEIFNQKVYDENCKGQTVCIISFLPNIYDSNAIERNQYIKTIQKVAKTNRQHPFTWFWLQAGDQLDLERQLNLGFGYPAVIAVSPKGYYGIMRGSFSDSNINDYLLTVISGRAQLDDLRQPLVFKKSDKWDGKDAAPFEEEYYDDDDNPSYQRSSGEQSEPHIVRDDL